VVPIRPGGGPGRGRWLVVLAGFLLVVAVIVLQRRVGGAPAASPSVDTSDRASPSSSSRSARIDAPPASAPSTAAPSTVTVTEQQQGGIEDPLITTGPWSTAKASVATSLAPTLIARASGWEIVGYGPQGLVRIDPATGRVWLVEGPELSNGSGYQSLVSGDGYTLVMDADFKRLLIPDDGPPRIPLKLLGSAALAFPGPDSSHLWTWDNTVGGGTARPTLRLVDWQERATGTTITLPDNIDPDTTPFPDGAGFLLVAGIGGTYDARPDGVRLVTTGTVIAAGPTGYLAYECGARPACSTIVVNRNTRARRILGEGSPSLIHPTSIVPGQISPDGSYAAYVQNPTEPAAGEPVHLVDLITGEENVLPVLVDADNTAGSVFGFSPDGRYLFVATLGGTIDIVDTHTKVVHQLPHDVPPVQSLTTRLVG
jgi:hypothetical protein